MKMTTALISLLLILSAPFALADGIFEDLPLPQGYMAGFLSLNFDGTVIGGDWGGPFVYTEADGVNYIDASMYGDFTTESWGNISGDGTTLAFNIKHPGNIKQAAYWNATDGVVLVPGSAMPDTCSSAINSCYGTNYDGTTFVGLGYSEGCDFFGFKWTVGEEFSSPLPDNGEGGRANDISGDGSVVGGWAYPEGSSSRTAAIWSGDVTDPHMLTETASEVFAVSNDGTRACGQMNGGCLYWDTTVGTVDIGALPGDEDFGALAMTVSNDGKVGGSSGHPFFGTPRGFIWTYEEGMMYAGDYFTMMGISGHEDLPIATILSISADGNTIVGAYSAPPMGNKQAFIVHLNGTVGNENPVEDEVVEDSVPTATHLVGAYPNPFNPMTTVKFSLDRDQHVSLYVYDMNGRRVSELASHTFSAGDHSLVWQGRDSSGRALASGNYLLRMVTESSVQTSKMMLVR